MKRYNCSKNKKVSSTRHDYRFTYRKIGYRFVLLLACILHRALNIYCNIYHQVQVATLTSLSVQIHLLRRRRKHSPLKLVYRFPITINCYQVLLGNMKRSWKSFFFVENFILKEFEILSHHFISLLLPSIVYSLQHLMSSAYIISHLNYQFHAESFYLWNNLERYVDYVETANFTTW